MGYMRHHAILVTSWDDKELKRAHREACSLFPNGGVSALTSAAVNAYRSFFVAPDGSKEGWAESDAGDTQRRDFVAYLRSRANEDGSNRLHWAEVQYGDDECNACVLQGSDLDRTAAIDRERQG